MRLVVALLLAALIVGPACGGNGDDGRPRLVTETVGRGAQTATIVRPDTDGPHPVVLFLHGWGATLPSAYRPWLDHLARRGNAVVYPRYQDSIVTPPRETLGNVLAGFRLALERVEEEPGSLVVAGHSAGGALSADYAAIARSAGLPVPKAIFAAYPGRILEGVPIGLPEIDPERIDPATFVVALASPDDRVVGTRVARRIVDGAVRVVGDRRRLVIVRERAVSDHLGPQRSDAASRATFWARLDALIREARR